MTYKQIETSREIRLWIGQLIVPAVTLATTIIIANPEFRHAAATKFTNIKNSVKNTVKRKGA